MKIYLVTFFILMNSCLYGQNLDKSFEINYALKSKDTAYTFLEKNYVKERADNNSKTISILGVGESIIIDTTFKSPYEEGYTKPSFYKIKYNGKSGYLSDTSIAIEKLKYDTLETFFLFKIQKTNDSLRSVLINEVNKKSKIVSEFKTPLRGEIVMLYLTDTRGLDSIEKIIVVDYISEACGMEDGETFFTWSPKNINLLAHISSVWDSDVYYNEENLIFPADSGGVKGQLIFKSETYELLDEETGWFTNTKTERTYKWVLGRITPEFKSKLNE